MGGDSFLNLLIQTLKARMTGLVTKIRMWTSWNFVRTKIISKIRDFFYSMLGVKPRDKNDYYTIGRWMISKRLVYAGIIVVGVASLWYISTETKLFSAFSKTGVRTYKYNSIRLHMAKDHVRITGKSGYLAYDGMVSEGYATGEGTLYNPQGNIVYVGNFEKNRYDGKGTENFPSGRIRYRGDFHDNYYEGEGILYREDGTTEYSGGFSQGKKNGQGILYDGGENEIYAGSFASDDIVYSELLGKTAAEVANIYKGPREMYLTDDESVIFMQAIGALYHGLRDPEALEDEEKVDSVYVLRDNFTIDSVDPVDTITELKDIFGDPYYEGNSEIVLPEAVAINLINERQKAFRGKVDMNVDRTFSDVTQVIDFDRNYPVYIYSFRRGELLYSFVCEDGADYFEFFYVTSEDEGGGE